MSFRLLVHGVPMVVARMPELVDATSLPVPEQNAAHTLRAARDRSAEPLVNLSGIVTIPASAQELLDAFPVVAAAIGPPAVSGLAALSTLVGMECPGLHSMLSELSVSTQAGRKNGPLAFRVRKYDAAFSRVEMEVAGYGIAGSVAAFAGRVGSAPPSDEQIRALVSPTEFAGQRPLVIGASSGLGAITARLLAAGGAHPTLTWHRSRDQAEKISRLISAIGGRCDLLPFDVTRPADGLNTLAQAGWLGGEVYYFASPRIFRRRLEVYQADDLRDFLAIYVDGFYEIVRGLMTARRSRPLAIFYPSSVAVGESHADLFEYSIAKQAGEQLCKRLEQKYKSFRIFVARLPRVATRQTQTFLRVQAVEPEHVMLPIMREVQACIASIDARGGE